MDGDRGDCSTRARTRAAHPLRGRAEEERGERDDDREAGGDEGRAADERAGRAAQPPGRVDRELGGGGPRQEVGRRDPVLEGGGLEPPPPLHAQPAEKGDVRNLTNTPGVAITSFTQAEVQGGLVVFVHDGTRVAPSYAVTVSDGMLSHGPLAAGISFDAGAIVVVPVAPPPAPGRAPVPDGPSSRHTAS